MTPTLADMRRAVALAASSREADRYALAAIHARGIADAATDDAERRWYLDVARHAAKVAYGHARAEVRA